MSPYDSSRSIHTRPQAGLNDDERQPSKAEVSGTDNDAQARSRFRGPALLGGLAAVIYALISLLRDRLLETGFDLTIFDQLEQQYSHFRTPDVLVKSQAPFNLLGDHFHPILILLAPFYRLWPDARMLLIAQALLAGVAVWVVTRFAVERLGQTGYFVGILFAASFGLIHLITFDFHEVAFAVPILALAMDCLLRSRYRWLFVWCFALLLVKEDSALLVVGIGLVLLLKRRYVFGAVLSVGGVAAFLFLVDFVIPYFSASSSYTYMGYLGHGVGGLLSTVLRTVFSGHGLLFLGVLAAMAGVGLTSPVIVALLPTLGARLLANNGAYTSLDYHYNATLMVICVFALIDALARFRHRPPILTEGAALVRRVQYGLVAVMIVFGVAASPIAGTMAKSLTSCTRCDDARQILALIPDGSRVIADTFLMPQIVDRTQVLCAVPSWTDSTGLPLEAPWVVLDLRSGYDPASAAWVPLRIKMLSQQGYLDVAHVGDFVLLKGP